MFQITENAMHVMCNMLHVLSFGNKLYYHGVHLYLSLQKTQTS